MMTVKMECVGFADRPSGRLHVGVVATWLKNSTPEQDSLTDLSYLSLGPSGPSSTMTGDQVGVTKP